MAIENTLSIMLISPLKELTSGIKRPIEKISITVPISDKKINKTNFCFLSLVNKL